MNVGEGIINQSRQSEEMERDPELKFGDTGQEEDLAAMVINREEPRMFQTSPMTGGESENTRNKSA